MLRRLGNWWVGLSFKGKLITLIGVFVIYLAASGSGGGSDAQPSTAAASNTVATTRATTPPATTPKAAIPEPSVAFQMAAVDTGNAAPSDSTVQRYQRALNVMDGACIADANTSHADYSIKATQIAAEQGVLVSAIEVLEGVGLSADEQRELGMGCAEVYAVFLTLLIEG